MTKADRWIGLLLVFFSLYVSVESWRLGLGTYHRPGPGFVSFHASVILGLLAVGLIFYSLRGEMGKGEGWGNLANICLVVLALFGFTLLFNRLGFIVTTFLFIGFLVKVVEQKGWFFSLSVALLVTGGSYAIFVLWLGAQLPAGILGR